MMPDTGFENAVERLRLGVGRVTISGYFDTHPEVNPDPWGMAVAETDIVMTFDGGNAFAYLSVSQACAELGIDDAELRRRAEGKGVMIRTFTFQGGRFPPAATDGEKLRRACMPLLKEV